MIESNYDCDEEPSSSSDGVGEIETEWWSGECLDESNKDAKSQSQTTSKMVASGESSRADDTSGEMEINNKTGESSENSNAEREEHKSPQCPKRETLPTQQHDESQGITCEICKAAVFTTNAEYQRHLYTHTGKRFHQCPTCKRWFSQLAQLHAHRFTHLEEFTFRCRKCPVERYFTSPEELSAHLLTHANDQVERTKRYECAVCHVKFPRKFELQRHERIHTKERPYECGFCKRTFIESGALKIHVRRHTGERPYKCKLCDRGFPSPSQYASHTKVCAKLLQQRKHKCPDCPKRYCHKSSLYAHRKTHKNKEKSK